MAVAVTRDAGASSMDRPWILTMVLVFAGMAIGVASFYFSITYVPPVPPPCDSSSLYCDGD